MQEQSQQITRPAEYGYIRSIVRAAYDLQGVRIQLGNRVTGNFKVKLGFVPGAMSEKELASEDKKVLDQLRESYRRITDGIVAEGDVVMGKLPTQKKFKADGLITTYTELILVDQYMTLLRDEKSHFAKLKKVLTGIPIYDEFLADIPGIGEAMAGVLISEIDITKAEYSSSLWAYAGMDSVNIGVYTDSKGVEHKIRGDELNEKYVNFAEDGSITTKDGNYPVSMVCVARSKKAECLVKRDYINKDGDKAVRDSITYNPFLKTKLVGVLGPAFLKVGRVFVDGKSMNGAKRKELAVSYGAELKGITESAVIDQIIYDTLEKNGHDVRVCRGEYGTIYYNYKHRLENSPAHKDKTPLHRHNMAIRYMIKRFLVNYYAAARRLAGLVAAEEYAVAKLHLNHKVATPNKGMKDM